ncbi:hypothetical protein [Streptomyces niveus]|uniref:hypothetical protein n=1 Tax=Streptomyces niveus TaxID=193462 RepID=UPI00369B4B08
MPDGRGQVNRPLWLGIAASEDGWAERLATARAALDSVPVTDEAAASVQRMISVGSSK